MSTELNVCENLVKTIKEFFHLISLKLISSESTVNNLNFKFNMKSKFRRHSCELNCGNENNEK